MLCTKCGYELNTVVCSHCGYDHTVEEVLYLGMPEERLTFCAEFEIVDGVLVKYHGSEPRINIPEGVTEIGASAFEDNTAISYVYIPEWVQKVGRSAFRGCTALENVVFGSKGSVKLGMGLFVGCTALDLVVLPRQLERIPDLMFHNCSALKSIGIPDTVREIGAQAFSECKALCNLLMGIRKSALERIETGAFFGCSSLELVIAPGVARVETLAFTECTALRSVLLGDNVQYLGSDAFSGCTALQSIRLGTLSGLKIGEDTFEGCGQLGEVSYMKRLPSGGQQKVTVYPVRSEAEAEIHRTADGFAIQDGVLLEAPRRSVLKIPEGVTDFGLGVLYNRPELTELEIPGSVERLPEYGIHSCEGLHTIWLNNGTQRIAQGAVVRCKQLQMIHVPNSVDHVSVFPFVECSDFVTVDASEAWKRAYPDYLEILQEPWNDES